MSAVSIIIPVYNRLVYLGATLESVLQQTYAHWELTIVDDGSQEDVEGFLQQYPDPRIRFLRQANQGNAAARNTGIHQSSGEYIICLDSDDVWHPKMLRTCVEYLQSNPDVDVAYTQVQAIDAEGTPLPRRIGPAPRNGDLLEPLLMGFPILPSSALARRRCFERWGMYTPGLDDWELWLRWAAKGCRFACIEEPLLYYRIHDRNFNLDWPRRRQAHFAMLDAFYHSGDLPPIALQMRDRAYANQHAYFAVLARQVGRGVDALAEFREAVKLNAELLNDLDFYMRIACAHQGRLDQGTVRNLDLALAAHAIIESLDALFAESALPDAVRARRRSAYGWAYLALGRLAYSLPHDMEQARRFLWQAFARWPSIAWRTDWLAWLMRSLVRYATIQRIKEIVGHRGLEAHHAS